MASSTTASQEELKANRVPVAWRDFCSLNELPWNCDQERHRYERCQYDDYMRRKKELLKQAAEPAEEAAEL